jgi:hypothetical protein
MIMESENRQFQPARGINSDTNTVKDNVTDLIKALPGNSSVNTVHYATIGSCVFYVVRAKEQ